MDFTLDFSIFQKRLRDIIESHGKMVQEVADDTGISKITLSRYLNNHREPDLKYVVALAQYFNVSIEWMLGLSDSKFEVLPQDGSYCLLRRSRPRGSAPERNPINLH